MIKIEVIIRKTVDQLTIEREYRAELPNEATPDQIAAVGREAQQAIENHVPEQEQGSVHIGNRGAQ